MNTLVLLYKMQWNIFINRFFKDKKQIAKTLLVALIVLGIAIGAIYFLNNKVIGDMGDPLEQELYLTISLVFSVIFMLIFFFQLFASLLGIIPNFYQSPDIHYLASTPIKSGVILIYKLFNHIISTIMKEAIFFFPVSIALAISLNVPPLFYLLLPIIYFMIAICSASIGVSFGMLFLRKFTVKSYRYLVNTGNFLLTASVWVFWVFDVSIPAPIVSLAEKLFSTEYGYLILPFLAGAEILAIVSTSIGKDILIPIALLVLVIVVIASITYFIAQKSFYTGLMKISDVKDTKKKKVNKKATKISTKNLSPMYSMIKYEWIRACKNFDIMAGALMFYALYGLLIYFSAKLGSESPITFLCIAMAVGITLVSTATSVPFVSSEITKNPLTAKLQYSPMKYLPFSSRDLILGRIIMIGLPSVIILTVGISILAFLLNVSGVVWLTVASVQILVAVGCNYMVQSYDMIYYQKYFDSNKFIGGVISLLITPIYLILTIGLYVLYRVQLPFLGFINYLNIPVIIIIAVATIIFQLTFVYRQGQRAWDKMEF